MIRVAAAAFVMAGSASASPAQPTDFGIRQVGGPKVVMPIVHEGTATSSSAGSKRSRNVSVKDEILMWAISSPTLASAASFDLDSH